MQRIKLINTIVVVAVLLSLAASIGTAISRSDPRGISHTSSHHDHDH